MKAKIFAVALVVCVMVGGLIFASCADGCPGDGNCSLVDGEPKYCVKVTVNASELKKIEQCLKDIKNGESCSC